MEMSSVFFSRITLMICGNNDIAVQTPAAIPIISGFSSMTLDELKIMPRPKRQEVSGFPLVESD